MQPDEIRHIYHNRRTQASKRLERSNRVREILAGRFDLAFRDLVPPGEEPAVGNLVSAAARTLSQRVGKMPKLQGFSRRESPSAKRDVEKHEAAMALRLEEMSFPALLPQGSYWLITHGMLPIVLRWDAQRKSAAIDIRDPMTCFPDTVWPHRPDVLDCLFVTEMHPWQVDSMYDIGNYFSDKQEKDSFDKVTIAEYHTPDGIYIAAVEPSCVPLDYIPNTLSGQMCVYVARDFSPDMDFYGQFDQVVPILVQQAKLMALVMAYAEQQVFSETYVIGEITSNQGDWAYGPKAVNQIMPSPSAGVGKVTNNMSMDVFRELDRLERAIRTSGGYPAQLSGETVASVATGRGLEQLTASVDDNVAHFQNIWATALKPLLNKIPAYEKAYGRDDTAWSSHVEVIPRFQAGTDPAASVRLLQLKAAKLLSTGTIMEQTPEIDNPEREAANINVEALREALINNVLAQASQGQADPALVTKLILDLQSGKALEKAYSDYQAAVQSQAPPAGIPGATGPPGASGEVPGEGPPPLDALIGMSVQGNPIAGVTGRLPVG